MAVIALVIALGLPAVASAQDEPNPLAAIESLRCSFPVFATVTWSEVSPEVATKTQEFSFQIDAINASEGTARIIGNAGADDLTVLLSSGGLSFLEATPGGNLNLTSVFRPHTDTDRLAAVHSRHIANFVPGVPQAQPYVSQNYGYCEVWQ